MNIINWKTAKVKVTVDVQHTAMVTSQEIELTLPQLSAILFDEYSSQVRATFAKQAADRISNLQEPMVQVVGS